MRQVVKIIRKENDKDKIEVLKMETDYLLSTLHQAIEENDEKEKDKCIGRLSEIHEEIKKLKEQL